MSYADTVLADTPVAYYKWHAAGTGGTAESNADTAMSVDSGVARFGGIAVVSGDSVQFTYQLTLNPEA
jgi:hypothetical protein